MSKNIDVSVRITADGKGLVVEANAAKAALGQLGDATRKAGGESSNFTSQINRQGAAQSAAADAVNSTTAAYGNQQTSITRLNGAMVGLTASIGAGIAAAAASVKGFIDFNRQLAGVSTLIEGTTEQMDALESASRSLAATYGKMPAEQAKTFYQVISSGVTDVTKATELLDEANKLSVAGMADLFATADSMTSIMNAYGNGVKSAADVSDVLFIGTLAGKTTIDELASSLGRVAPIAESVGVGFDELTSAISALTLGGISTAESVTGVRAILAAVIKPSSEAIEVANALGIEFDSAAIKAKGFGGFMEDLVAKTQGSQEALGLLFGGVEAIVPALALAGKAGDSYNSIMQQMAERTGATQTAFEKMAASPGFKVDRLMVAIKDTAITLGDALAGVLIPAAEGATKALSNLFGVKNLSAIDKQKQSIAEMQAELESLGNRKHVPLIGDLIFDKKQADLLKQRIEDATTDLAKMSASARESAQAGNAVTQSIKNESDAKSGLAKVNQILAGLTDKGTEKTKESTKASDRAVESSNRIIAALKLETEQIGLNAIQKRMMSAAAEAAKAPTKELANEIMGAAAAWGYAAQQQENLQAAEKERIEGLKAIERAEKEAARASEEAARKTQQDWRSMWSNVEQTGRTTFTQLLVHGKSAFESIGQTLKIAVADVLYYLTVRKWIINIGTSLEGAFLGSAGTAAASGRGAGGASAWDIANGGTGALNLLKGGFGVPGFIGNMGSSLPGAAGLFFTGMAGKGATQLAAEAGAMSLWGASGATTSAAASMGSAFAAAAGPMMAAYMATQLFRGLAGDRRIGGGFGKFINKIGDIPILGDLMPGIPLLNALFGRGPLKQKETSLTGLIGAEGFESGMLQTRFKASGSVFRSSKTDFARIDAITGEIWTDNQKQLGEFAQGLSKAAKEIFGAFNDAAKGASAVLNQTGKDLGLSTEALQGFSYELNLVSEKGKGLTEEQISEEIENLTDAMARKLLPQIDDLAKRGETALQAVSRLGTEFTSLVDTATLILGKSDADAKSMILGASFEGRTAFVDNAGGIDALNQASQYFAANFLTDTERLAISESALNSELTKLGLSTDLTREQFKGLVQSFGQVNGVSEETLQSLLKLQYSFVDVRNAQDQLRVANQAQAMDVINRARQHTEAVAAERSGLEARILQLQGDTTALRQRELEALDPVNRALQERIYLIQDEKTATENAMQSVGSAFSALQRSVGAERTRITDDYNTALELSNTRIQGVTESIGKLKTLSEALKSTVSQLRPLDRDQARQQIQNAINTARSGGDLPAADNLRDALNALGNQTAKGTTSSFEAVREQRKTANLVAELEDLTGAQLTLEERSLAALEDQKKRLEDGFRDEIGRLDDLLTQGQAQIDALNGIDTSILSLADALAKFNASVGQAGQSAGGGQAGGAAAGAGNSGQSAVTAATSLSLPPLPPVGVLGGAGNPAIGGRDIVRFLTSGVTPEQGLAKALETGVSARQIVNAFAGQQGYTLDNIRSFVQSQGLVPAFAEGGFHRGGLRIVGERGPELEYTGPSRIASNNDLSKLLSNDDVVVALRALIAEVQKNNEYNRRVAEKLDAVTQGGNALRTKTA